MSPARRGSVRLAAALLAVVAAVAVVTLRDRLPQPVGRGTAAEAAPDAGSDALRRAFEERAEGRDVRATGRVVRILPDDRDGSRHQRFVVEVRGGQTILVAHNIDLAPRVPLSAGDEVTVTGVYEWNDRGGVVHWTHHDPRGRRTGGSVEHRGRVYR